MVESYRPISLLPIFGKIFEKIIFNKIYNFLFLFCFAFFFIWVFFHEHSLFTGQQRKGESIFLTPLYHFHLLHRHLGISQAITVESSSLHIASSRNQTGNLWFPSASRQPLSYAPLNPNQSGFHPSDSCINQLLAITLKIFKAFDCNPPLEVRSVF